MATSVYLKWLIESDTYSCKVCYCKKGIGYDMVPSFSKMFWVILDLFSNSDTQVIRYKWPKDSMCVRIPGWEYYADDLPCGNGVQTKLSSCKCILSCMCIVWEYGNRSCMYRKLSSRHIKDHVHVPIRTTDLEGSQGSTRYDHLKQKTNVPSQQHWDKRIEWHSQTILITTGSNVRLMLLYLRVLFRCQFSRF